LFVFLFLFKPCFLIQELSFFIKRSGDDLNRFFKAPTVVEKPKPGQNQATYDDLVELVHPVEIEETLSHGAILSFNDNKWSLVDSNLQNNRTQFIHTFKLLTYNILSKFNLKKGLVDKKLAETNLDRVERMDKILDVLEKSGSDFLLLQECEQYELAKLRESPFIQANYSILTTNGSVSSVDGLAILSKYRPVFVKQLKFSKVSSKMALIAKFSFRVDSLRRVYDMIVVNVHLTSNKAAGSFDKRREQIRMLRELLLDTPGDNDLKCDYLFIGGDFNVMDEAVDENKFIVIIR
jgi:mRNA deadenylase 3'-5' endonuclease subunit Ccr4